MSKISGIYKIVNNLNLNLCWEEMIGRKFDLPMKASGNKNARFNGKGTGSLVSLNKPQKKLEYLIQHRLGSTK